MCRKGSRVGGGGRVSLVRISGRKDLRFLEIGGGGRGVGQGDGYAI